MDKKKEIRKVPVFLFNDENPKGEMFRFYGGKESDEYKKMVEDGWVDSPARLKLPKEMDTGLTEEMVVNADPQRLIAILEGYGFICVTQEQLKAEAVKMANVAIDMGNFSDEDLITEAERRGLKKSTEENETKSLDHTLDSGAGSADLPGPKGLSVLIEKFKSNNESLTKEDLLIVGKELKLGFLPNWKEETMIKKINEKLNEA